MRARAWACGATAGPRKVRTGPGSVVRRCDRKPDGSRLVQGPQDPAIHHRCRPSSPSLLRCHSLALLGAERVRRGVWSTLHVALCMLRFAFCALHFVRACRPRRNGTGTHKRGLNDGLCGWAGWMGCVMGCVMGCGWRRSPAQSVGGSCRGRAAQKVSRGAGGAQGAQDMQ